MRLNIIGTLILLIFSTTLFRAMNPGEKFAKSKAILAPALINFLDTFATWSEKDRGTFIIRDNSFLIYNLSSKKQIPYGGNLTKWLGNRIETEEQKIALLNCIRYLQGKKD